MRGYIDTVARVLHGGQRRGRSARVQRTRGRRSTFVPPREDAARIIVL